MGLALGAVSPVDDPGGLVGVEPDDPEILALLPLVLRCGGSLPQLGHATMRMAARCRSSLRIRFGGAAWSRTRARTG
jgi:hypothetical protein